VSQCKKDVTSAAEVTVANQPLASKRALRFAPLSDAELTPTEPQLLTIKNVAAMMQLSDRTVLRLKKSRVIPFIKIGGAVRFRRADVMQALARRTVEAVS
jgi:excisionase family DNA binding protein